MANHSRGAAAATRPAPALEADAAALYTAMTDLLRVYQFRDRDRAGYHGLTITQCYVLEVLERRGPITLNALAEEMRLDKSTLSRVVDGLERKKSVRRMANPSDGRSALLATTAAGASRYRRVAAELIAENARVLSGFPATTRRQLIELIGRLARAARDRELEAVEGA